MRRLLLAFSFAIVGHVADTVAQPLTFARSDHPSVAGARALVAADFDRNGWPDLAHANIGRNSVSVLLDSATTGMTRRAEIAVGAGPFDLTTGDFNRDGIPDLAVANADGNSISILLGTGNGSFSRTDILTPSHQPRGITTGDVNNDGNPDLVYTGYLTGVVQVLSGDGAGGFTAGARLAAPAARPQGVATGDFNHDGILDVAVAHATATGLRILYGSRAGTFAAHAVSGHGYLNVLGVADLDADGWIDIAAASTSASTVGVYRGGPTGLVHTGTYATGLSPRGLSIADVNGDGAFDLVTANRGSRTVTILLGDPAHPGAFLPALHVPAGAGSRAVAAADFDNDGRVDIAVGNEYAAAATLLLNTTPFARAAYSFGEMTLPAGGMPFSHHPLVTADFNRDGRLDVASPGASGVFVMLTGYPSLSLTGPHPFSQFFASDVEADGDADVVYVAADSANLGGGIHTRVVTFLNDGSGFTPSAETVSPLWLRRCVAGDMNRDARMDLVCVGLGADQMTQVLHVMTGRGDGTFGAGATVALAEAGQDLQLADINRDGALDVVVLQSMADVWRGDGSGGLSPAGRADLGGVSYPQRLRVADLNRDARPDLVVVGNSGELVVVLGTAGGFSEPVVSTWFGYGAAIEIADLDLDGHPDIIAQGHPGLVLRGRGDGTFEAAEGFAFWGPVTVADITGDGLPDLLSRFGEAIRVLVNRRSDVNRPPTVTASDRTLEYYQLVVDAQPGEDCPLLSAEAADPDQHAVAFEWHDAGGRLVSSEPSVGVCTTRHGSYEYRLTARDGRGGVAMRTVTLTILPGKELVVYATVAPGVEKEVWLEGRWTQVSDPSGADGLRAYHPDRGAPKVTVPTANPVDTIRIRFTPDPTQTYKLWVRLKAERNAYANDSVWLQFSGATDASGMPVYRIGTTSALPINLEECSGCGLSGWGWEDDGWGAVDRNGVTLRFPDGGRQEILIQTREDGVSVDQVLLSSDEYLTRRPGLAKDDHTIFPRTYTENPH